MVFVNPNKLSFLIVQNVVAVLSASYYQKEYSGYSFTISSEYLTPTDAQAWCNLNGSKLLAITNSSIQSAVVAFINDAKQQNQLESNYIITDGKRTSGSWKWINGTNTSSLSIGAQDANSGYAYLNTTSTTGYYLWAARPTDTNYYICEFSGQTSCDNGYQNGGQCFQSVTNENVTWFEARNRCLLKGGDLATFEFITDSNNLKVLNGPWINPSKKYWIGLRRQWWTWMTIASDVTYSHWADGRPIYYSTDPIDCLSLESNAWNWTTWRCTDRAQFVCIRASYSATVGTTTLKTTSVISISQSSSTLNNFKPQSSSSTPAIHNETKEPINSEKGSNDSLAIGVGVGVGGGVFLLIILIIVLFLLSRKGYIRKSSSGTVNGESAIAPYETLQTRSTVLRDATCGSLYQELTVTRPSVDSENQN